MVWVVEYTLAWDETDRIKARWFDSRKKALDFAGEIRRKKCGMLFRSFYTVEKGS